jgi:type VI protein secretion system component Hcp
MKLAQTSQDGTNIGTVFIEVVVKKGNAEVAVRGLQMSNVIISSYEVSGGRVGAPEESMSLDFSRIQFT